MTGDRLLYGRTNEELITDVFRPMSKATTVR